MARHSVAAHLLYRAGVGQDLVAKELGVGRTTVSRMLSGEREPDPRLFDVVSELGGVDLAAAVAEQVAAAGRRQRSRRAVPTAETGRGARSLPSILADLERAQRQRRGLEALP